MGIIDSLSAGYRFVGRRIELLLIPVLLDTLLWLTPRLSVAPILDRLAAFYQSLAAVDGITTDDMSEIGEMSEQLSTMLTAIGQNVNLLDMLANSLLYVPSLIRLRGPALEGSVVEITNGFTALGLFAVFGLTGILIGVIYMNLLAMRLPLGGAPKPATVGGFIILAIRHYGMVLLYIGLLFVLVMAAVVPAAVGTSLISLVSPALGSLFVILVAGLITVVMFYLFFVIAALILDNLPVHRAIVQSFSLVRTYFWSTLGFFILTILIGDGMALTVRQLATFAPVGTAAAILINAFVGSGLAMALLVFYRTRVLRITAGEELAQESVEWQKLR